MRRRLTPALAALFLLGLPVLSSAQMPGTNLLPRPGATGTTFAGYDWTGLHIQGYQKYFGDPMWYPDPGYDNQYGGSAYGPDWFWYFDFGSYWDTYEAKITMSVTSTYKWQWMPPNKRDAQDNDLGTPDLDNFPVPNLFFLARLQGRVSAGLLSQL